jgi:hypothetical protein
LRAFADAAVLENVMVGCYPRTEPGSRPRPFRTGPSAPRRASRSAWTLLGVELADHAHELAGSLPFGQRLLDRARSPPINAAALDEPAAGLNAEGRARWAFHPAPSARRRDDAAGGASWTSSWSFDEISSESGKPWRRQPGRRSDRFAVIRRTSSEAALAHDLDLRCAGGIVALKGVDLTVPGRDRDDHRPQWRRQVDAAQGHHGVVDREATAMTFDRHDIRRKYRRQVVRLGVALNQGARFRRGGGENLVLRAIGMAGARPSSASAWQRSRALPVLRGARQTASTLSGGEQQMLAIGQALMAGPRLLLDSSLWSSRLWSYWALPHDHGAPPREMTI